MHERSLDKLLTNWIIESAPVQGFMRENARPFLVTWDWGIGNYDAEQQRLKTRDMAFESSKGYFVGRMAYYAGALTFVAYVASQVVK